MSISWPALAAWAISVGIALGLWFSEVLHRFFIAIPLWFVSAALYTALAAIAGAKAAGRVGAEDAAPVVRSVQSTVGARRRRPAWLRAVGLVAQLSLLSQFVLPLWVMSCEGNGYESQLPSCHFWLGVVSVIHLATVAAWVLLGEPTLSEGGHQENERGQAKK